VIPSKRGAEQGAARLSCHDLTSARIQCAPDSGDTICNAADSGDDMAAPSRYGITGIRNPAAELDMMSPDCRLYSISVARLLAPIVGSRGIGLHI
jgi:hypothetical protein